MELPQPRPYGTEGKKPTHDFLSLYGDSSFQQHQDPRPSQEFYLKTHDFLQPLERVGKSNNSTEGEKQIAPADKPSSIEHILPGGIGTYSISHIPSFGRGIVKPEGSVYAAVQATSAERNEEASKANSNCSSYSGGGFTLWEESTGKEKRVVKDRVGDSQLAREPSEKSTQLPPFISCNTGFSSLTSSNNFQGQMKQGFMEMMRSVKGFPEDEDDDEDDYVKKEVVSSLNGDIGAKVDMKGNDQRANTPRSKHSATEQRRRSKINDRFQILRELIPHSDQKRDKASFLLEVIEYIQFLQEKVQKCEAAFPGWNQDNMKLTPWRHNHGLGESITDHSQAIKNGASAGLMFAGKFDGNHVAVTPSMLGNSQNPVESDNMSAGTRFKALDHHPGSANKAASVPIPLQQNFHNSVGRNSGIVQPQPRLMPDAENMASQSQLNLWRRSCPTDSNILNEQEELAIEGGTIHLSSVYSQGLLSSLTQALQSSGIDLSRASISVQIDLGKRATSRPSTTTSSAKDHEDPSSCNRTVPHSRVASSGEDSDLTHKKRLRTDNR